MGAQSSIVSERPRVPQRAGALAVAACILLTTASGQAVGTAATKTRYREIPMANLADRPAGTFVRRCSVTASVCVQQAGNGADEATTRLYLAAAERALLGLGALKLTLPAADGSRGGDGRLDLYLDPSATSVSAHGDVGAAVVGYDRASAFLVAPARAKDSCVVTQAVAKAVGAAALLGQDAALDPGSLDMLAGRLGMLLEPCSAAEIEAVDAAQRAPEQTFVGALGYPGEAAFLFPWFLEDRYGTDEPGKLTFALAAISGQRTESGPLSDEPDAFDALRVTQQNNKSSISETMLDFAVARAFLGSRSDEQHIEGTAYLGDLARPRFEWSVRHDSLPRRLAPTRPVHPLGSTYLYIDTRDAAPNAELTFVAEWETPATFRWAIVRLDAEGGELSRVLAVPVLGETRIQRDIRDLAGAKGLLIVGLNEGEASRSEPFDPGQPREDPKGYVVTLHP